MTRLHQIWSICFALTGAFLTSANAQSMAPTAPPEKSDEGIQSVKETATAQTIAELQARARAIHDLMEGKLDLSVEAQSLFEFRLDEIPLQNGLETLLKLVDEAEARKWRPKRRKLAGRKTETAAVNEDPSSGESPLRLARQGLFDALAAFFTLPEKERQALLDEHRARQKAAKAAEKELKQKTLDLAKIKQQIAELRAFQQGELALELDPVELLRVNLSDVHEVVLDSERRRHFMGNELLDAPLPARSPEKKEVPEGLDAELQTQRGELDKERQKFLSLGAAEKAALFAKHKDRRRAALAAEEEAALKTKVQVAEAEEAARLAAEERERALEASRRARTEANRALEEERARLLKVKEAQALFDIALAEERKKVEHQKEVSLAWSRRVRELSSKSVLDGDKHTESDQMYGQLVTDLTEVRTELGKELSRIQSGESRTPMPTSADKAALAIEVNDTEVQKLREELEQNGQRQRNRDAEIRWELATSLRNAMVAMNRARLDLFATISEGKRSQLRGFGPQGVRQVQRELTQIVLEARYYLLSLPRFLRAKYQELKVSPVPIVSALFKFILLIIVFRWWRKRADATLNQISESWLARRPQTGFARGVATAAWYLKQVRHPVEWLIFTGILANAVTTAGDLPEIAYARILIAWPLVGLFFIHLLHAIAERQGKREEDTAKLRFRSLRLVGISAVALGQVLALSEASVGRGAIYGWAKSLFWAVGIPIIIILIAWWRKTIFTRAESIPHPTGVIKWVVNRKRGMVSFPAAAIGGAYLLGDGIYRFALKQISHLSLTRRILAYTFRREVEKQASLAADDGNYRPIDSKTYQALDPSRFVDGIVASYMQKKIQVIRDLVRSDNNAIVAVVGERGIGKTTFVERVAEDLKSPELCHVRCEPGGFDIFLRQIAVALGIEEASTEDQIVNHLHRHLPVLICIDDAHRLIRPLIGGLRDMDRLIHFAHRVGSTTSWLMAIGTPAWQYLKRARGERAMFDEVAMLRPWTEEQIAELVGIRNKSNSLEPRFDKVAVPRQVRGMETGEEDRTERDFYRILWDYSGGNPAVSLHFWRESLFCRNGTGHVYVRLFKGPSANDLEDLPSTFYFVLRSILQLELALESDIVKCTDLQPPEVADALRAAISHDYIDYEGERICLNLAWYRAVVQVLERKHLLML